MPLTVSKMFAIVLLCEGARLEYGESQDAYILLGTRNIPPDPNRNENERKKRKKRKENAITRTLNGGSVQHIAHNTARPGIIFELQE